MHTPLKKALATAVAVVATSTVVRAQLTGAYDAHDPSTIVKDGSAYWYFSTGQGIAVHRSTDGVNWSAAGSVFSTPPAWTTTAVSGFTGGFWAPDVAYFGGLYHLYYSASTWGSIDSAIGVATSPTLTNAVWTDRGKVVQSDAVGQTSSSTDTTAYNAIDPSILVDTNGRVYMAFGSYSSGILVTELDPTTGLRKNTSSLVATPVANNAPGGGWGSSVEGSALIKKGNYYYLFVNYGGCCSGVDSTYNIRVGRSTSPTGPFLDKNGVNMMSGGGTLFLDDDGAKIGPGHFAMVNDGGAQDRFSFHYYNGDANGAPTLGIDNLYWTADGWPIVGTVAPSWSGNVNYNWSNASNWSDGVVPDGVGAVANFRSVTAGHNIVTVDGAAKTLSRINFDSSANFVVGNGGTGLTLDAMSTDAAATINVASGQHIIAAPITAVDDLGINVTPADARLTLSGGATGKTLRKYGYGTLSLGGTQTFAGSLLVHEGSVILTGATSTTGFTAIGQGVGDTGALTVQGNGSFSTTADLNIGDTGDANTPATGTLTLRDTASITVGTTGGFYVGSGFSANRRAVGTVNQSGGSLTASGNFDGAFVIGGRGSALATGTYNLSGGTVTANTNVQVGGRGTGTIAQTGGTFTANSWVSIGRYAGATGFWTITSGSINHANANTLFIVGESGAGTLTVGGSGSLTTAGGLRLGHATGGSGSVNLNTGGTITTTTVSRNTGSASFTFNGGTLRAYNDQADFFRLSPTESEIGSAGAIIDSNGHAITITRALDGVGGLTKTGAGTLGFSVDQSFTGGVTVNAGTLSMTRANNNGPLAIGANGTLSFVAPSTPYDPNHRSVTTSLAIAAGGSLNLDQNALVIDYTGLANLAALRTMVASGSIHGGANNTSPNIGYADAASLASIPSAFGSVDSTALLVRATSAGDTNLDGATNFSDLLALAKNYGTSGDRVWTQGDLDYDADVDFNDLLALAKGYGSTAVTSADLSPAFAADFALAQSMVPEPAIAGLVLTTLAMRRRRN